MITKFLENHISVIEKVDTWEDSIRLASKILIDKKYITPTYVEAMIQNVKVNGPYVVIMTDVAMPHSRPEDGVNKTTISLLKLNEKVMYPEEKTVKLVFVLAAKDSDKHLELIAGLSDLLCDNDKVQGLMDSKTIEGIIDVLSVECI